MKSHLSNSLDPFLADLWTIFGAKYQNVNHCPIQMVTPFDQPFVFRVKSTNIKPIHTA